MLAKWMISIIMIYFQKSHEGVGNRGIGEPQHTSEGILSFHIFFFKLKIKKFLEAANIPQLPRHSSIIISYSE